MSIGLFEDRVILKDELSNVNKVNIDSMYPFASTITEKPILFIGPKDSYTISKHMFAFDDGLLITEKDNNTYRIIVIVDGYRSEFCIAKNILENL